ncbi:hypothetical protein IJM86_08245 [bacterium]|nr:hypothetical protein [bacterium]
MISKGTETFSTWSGSFSEGTTITIDGANLTVGEQTFTAQASSGATFSGWNNTCGTTITSDCSVVAEFTQEEISGLSLSFDSDGGSIIPAVVGLETGADISGYRPKKDPTKA